MRHFSGWFAFVLLLGAVIGFAAGKFDRPAEAQAVDNKTTRWLAGTVSYGQGFDAFLLFDSQTNRLMAYTFNAQKQMELMAVREISYDMKLVTFGTQKPGVGEIKKLWEEEQKKRPELEEEK